MMGLYAILPDMTPPKMMLTVQAALREHITKPGEYEPLVNIEVPRHTRVHMDFYSNLKYVDPMGLTATVEI
eukprot:1150133-Rhodomonas_salina.1